MLQNKTKDKIKAYIEILRPGWWIACFFVGLATGMLAIYWKNDSLDDFFRFKTIMWTSGYWLSVLGIYVFNDFVGFEEDTINNPKRPIPSGMIDRKAALIYSLILLIIGIGLFWITFRNPLSSLVQLTCIGLIAIYSARYKNNILLGLGAGLTPIGIWIALAPFNMIPVAMFFLFFFWELTLDVPENLLHYEGDLKTHPQTFAILLGREKFSQIGVIFAISSVIASICLFFLLDMSYIFLFFTIIAGIFLIKGTLSLRKNITPIQLGKSLGLAMLYIFLINIGLMLHVIYNSL